MNIEYHPELVQQLLKDCSQHPLNEVKQLLSTRFPYTLLFLNDLNQLDDIYGLIQQTHSYITEEKEDTYRLAELTKNLIRLNWKLRNPLYRLLLPKKQRQELMLTRLEYQNEICYIEAKHSLENFAQSSLNSMCHLVDQLEILFKVNNSLGGAHHVLFSSNKYKLENQMIYKIVTDFFHSRNNPVLHQ